MYIPIYTSDHMEYTEAILVKVDKLTKKRMKDKRINWSAEIRKFISDRLKLSSTKNLAKAVAISDRLYRKAKAKNYDSTAVIRKFRDERYGPSGN